MKSKAIKIMLSILMIIIFSSCSGPFPWGVARWYTVGVKNDSDKSVVFMFDVEKGSDGIFTASTSLNQTELPTDFVVALPAKTGETIMVKAQYVNIKAGDRVDAYVFDADVLEEHSWQDVKTKQLWLKKIEISAVTDAYLCDTIVYP